MADVNPPIEATDRDRSSSRGGSRAQLIIVTGLAIGVTLIALVVILNTVIYTENLATRSAGVGGQDAIQYRATAIEATGGVLDRENLEDYDAQSKATDNVTHGVDRVDRLLRLQHVEGETAAEITNVSADDGAIVRQTDDTRQYLSSGGVGSWDVVTGVEEDDLRQFDLTVTSSTIDSVATDPSSGFNVTVIDSLIGDEWRLSVYQSSGDVVLAVHNGSQPGATTGICGSPYSDSKVEIDLTAGTVEDQPCDAIRFGEGLSGAKTVRFVRGTRVGGTFNATVNQSDPGVLIGFGVNPPPSTASPYFAEAVYSLRFDVHYEQPRLTYHDRVRVAPDEAS